MTIVAACIPVLHPLYDRARAGLRKMFPSLRRADQGTTTVHHPDAPGGAPDTPHGFWSMKLRAIGLAESWWSSTAGRTSRRSGVRVAGEAGEEEEDTRGTAPGTVMSSGDGGLVVVHSEGEGTQSDLGRSRDLTVSVDAVVEMSDLERGRDLVGGHGPGDDGGGRTAVIGQK